MCKRTCFIPIKRVIFVLLLIGRVSADLSEVPIKEVDMVRKSKTSVKAHLRNLAVLFFLIIIACLLIAVYFGGKGIITEKYREHVLENGKVFSDLAGYSLAEGKTDLLKTGAETVASDSGFVKIQILDSEGSAVHKFNRTKKNGKDFRNDMLIEETFPITYKNNKVGTMTLVFTAEPALLQYRNTLLKAGLFAVIILIPVSLIYTGVLRRRITSRLRKIAHESEKLALGNFGNDITVAYDDEIGVLTESMNKMKNNIGALLREIQEVSRKTSAGIVTARMNAEQFSGEYKEIAREINETLEALLEPFYLSAEYIDRISKGDLPPYITKEFKGDYKEIKTNLNLCIESISLLIEDSTKLAEAAVEGKLEVRADCERHYGDYKKIIEGVNKSLDSFLAPVIVTSAMVERIAKGDMPNYIPDAYPGDYARIKKHLQRCIDSISTLVEDSRYLAESAFRGKLRERVDPNKLSGDFYEVLKGLNAGFDAFVGMLDSLDTPIMAIDKDFNILFVNKLAAKLGKKERKELPGTKCYKHYKTADCGTENCIAKRVFEEGINQESHTTMQPGDKKFDVHYFGSPVKDKAGQVIGVFTSAVDNTEIKKSMEKAQKISEYQKKAAESIVTELDKLSKGDFTAEFLLSNIDSDTEDAFLTLKKIVEASETFAGAVRRVEKDISKLSRAASSGELDVRATPGAHQGVFAEIVESLNGTVDAFLAPVTEAGEVLGHMSRGDLLVRMKGEYEGKLEQLKSDINSLGESLHEIVKGVNESAIKTDAGAAEIFEAAESLSRFTREMNVNTAAVADSTSEVSDMVRVNAENAIKTTKLADQNTADAREGGDIVRNTIEKINDIANVVDRTTRNIESLGQSTQEIGLIVRVIDEIADQTNLLALNASIEAARAGEQGRGFAVVADEVRKLADKTVKATQEISEQIAAIQKETADTVEFMKQGTDEVKKGIEYAGRAGEALEKILGSSDTVTDGIGEIAVANEKQALTVEMISGTIQNVSVSLQEAEKRVSDVSGVADILKNMTVELSTLMKQFKVSGGIPNLALEIPKDIKGEKSGSELPAHNAENTDDTAPGEQAGFDAWGENE